MGGRVSMTVEMNCLSSNVSEECHIFFEKGEEVRFQILKVRLATIHRYGTVPIQEGVVPGLQEPHVPAAVRHSYMCCSEIKYDFLLLERIQCYETRYFRVYHFHTEGKGRNIVRYNSPSYVIPTYIEVTSRTTGDIFVGDVTAM